MGATILDGYLPGERFPISGPRGQYGAMCMLGTFSQYGTIHQNSVVKVDDDLPLDKAVLVGCGVPTGWGSAVYAADVRPGETVLVYGVGGIGINAVQGARYAGAKNVIAVDPLENKREKAMELGATHAVATAEEADTLAKRADPRRDGADKAILTVGLMEADVVGAAFGATGKGSTIVLTGLEQADGADHPAAGHDHDAVEEDREGHAVRRLQPDHATSRRSSGSTRAATSSSTRSSPGPTPSTRSTRATRTCSTARTCAASSCTSTDRQWSDEPLTPVGRAHEIELLRAALTAAHTSCWKGRPAPARARCCVPWRPPRTCRSCSWRATPSSRRHGWSGTSIRRACSPTATPRRSSSTARSSPRCAAAVCCTSRS